MLLQFSVTNHRSIPLHQGHGYYQLESIYG